MIVVTRLVDTFRENEPQMYGRRHPAGPERDAKQGGMIQQFLLQFTGTLNRRRAYAATHPMVVTAEERLLECANALLAAEESLALGVARDELLINGEPYVTKSTYARELATKLHRRGVGAITFERGLLLTQLSDALTWLASEKDFLPFAPTRAGGVRITTIGYDHLVLDDSIASAEASVSTLWRTLAALAESGVAVVDGPSAPPGATGRGAGAGSGAIGTGSGSGTGRSVEAAVNAQGVDEVMEQAIDDAVVQGSATYVDGELTGVDSAQVLTALQASMRNPAVARSTALALAEIASTARGSTIESRQLIGSQLTGLLTRLGMSTFAPIISSLADHGTRTRFVTDVADVLPFGAVVDWMRAAAVANGQQMSHQLLRLMTKMSTLADTRFEAHAEAGFRDAARTLVTHWELSDPNPIEHVELLDRIARFERIGASTTESLTVLGTTIVESSRIVQMALELDLVGEDTADAADALVMSGVGPEMIQWASQRGGSRTAIWLYGIATSEKAVRHLLLTEPVDRLQARALLDVLDQQSTGVLLDVLEQAQARGTRMIVRQRLAEFGSAITPLLLARLESAPWFMVRNILTLLQELETGEMSTSAVALVRLLEHPQVQVRTEAVRVLVLNEQTRDAALQRALRDENERVVVLAIQLVSDRVDDGTPLPASLTAQLLALVDAGDQSDPVRARAVRVAGSVVRDDIRDWLVQLTTRRTPFLRRLRLVDPTQTAATALQILQRAYAADPAVAGVRALAAKVSHDTRWQVRETAMERTP